MLSPGGARGVQKAELNGNVDSENNHGGSSRTYVLHRTGCSQEDDHLLRQGCERSKSKYHLYAVRLIRRPESFCRSAKPLFASRDERPGWDPGTSTVTRPVRPVPTKQRDRHCCS